MEPNEMNRKESPVKTHNISECCAATGVCCAACGVDIDATSLGCIASGFKMFTSPCRSDPSADTLTNCQNSCCAICCYPCCLVGGSVCEVCGILGHLTAALFKCCGGMCVGLA